METLLELVAVQLSVEDPPGSTVSGSAEQVIPGALMVTSAVSVSVPVPSEAVSV